MHAMRLTSSWVAVAALAFAAAASCKKKDEPPPPPPPSGSAKPSSGHSHTHLKGSGEFDDEADGSGATADGSGSGSAAPADAGEQPAFRDDDGRIHGPGGKLFIGRLPYKCDGAHDNCMRDGVWFIVNNVKSGKLFRAEPAFLFENKWYTWRGDLVDDAYGQAFHTKTAGNAPIKPGTTVVAYISEDPDAQYSDSAYDTLTSSNWDAAITGDDHGDKVQILGWGDVQKGAVRLITDTKQLPAEPQ